MASAGLAGMTRLVHNDFTVYACRDIFTNPLFQMRSILLVHLLFCDSMQKCISFKKTNVIILATEQESDSAWTDCHN